MELVDIIKVTYEMVRLKEDRLLMCWEDDRAALLKINRQLIDRNQRLKDSLKIQKIEYDSLYSKVLKFSLYSSQENILSSKRERSSNRNLPRKQRSLLKPDYCAEGSNLRELINTDSVFAANTTKNQIYQLSRKSRVDEIASNAASSIFDHHKDIDTDPSSVASTRTGSNELTVDVAEIQRYSTPFLTAHTASVVNEYFGDITDCRNNSIDSIVKLDSNVPIERQNELQNIYGSNEVDSNLGSSSIVKNDRMIDLTTESDHILGSSTYTANNYEIDCRVRSDPYSSRWLSFNNLNTISNDTFTTKGDVEGMRGANIAFKSCGSEENRIDDGKWKENQNYENRFLTKSETVTASNNIIGSATDSSLQTSITTKSVLSTSGKNKHASSDVLPSAPLRCIEVVRSKQQREALPGFTCEECLKFYETMQQQGIYALNDSQQRRDVLQACSRHKSVWVPPSTPEGFWNLSLQTPDNWR